MPTLDENSQERAQGMCSMLMPRYSQPAGPFRAGE
jgi:hypothetical protein